MREPTRDEYLFDLYLSALPGTKMVVGASITDHRILIAEIPAPSIASLKISRQNFRLAKADREASMASRGMF